MSTNDHTGITEISMRTGTNNWTFNNLNVVLWGRKLNNMRRKMRIN